MKHLLLFLSIAFLSNFQTQAQLKNINPDPNGEPWIVGGLKMPDKDVLAKIPAVQLSNDHLYKSTNSLPAHLDNTTRPYFRPIFNQSDGSCAQASGVAYNFTYEINRERGTAADVAENQYPSHYTYNFLNGGDGDNGSFYTDGWDIIKANGCPNINTYGGSLNALGEKGWMTGYQKYEAGMANRVHDYFKIDVSTPNGLLTLKHWLYDHLENAPTGGLANFAAGIANAGFNRTNNGIITAWGNIPDHAMTFVGWDDSISYDYNNDGQITNNIDINGDDIIDMRDWERGAMIMVNSWGTSWANQGKAYVMYKTLAEPIGGVAGNEVYAVNVKATQNPQLTMRIKMSHSLRNQITVTAGIATDLNATAPEYTLDFPLFHQQGGAYPLQGNSINPIEVSLDISPLLSHVNPGETAKYFLIVNETDMNDDGSGLIFDYAIVDNQNQIVTCDQHDVSIQNNTDTVLSINSSVSFNKPEITTEHLPSAEPNTAYSQPLDAMNGNAPYEWSIVHTYNTIANTAPFPNISSQTITNNSNDDGYGQQILDFDFPFYGQLYHDITVLTDGSIIFEPVFQYLRTEDAIKSHKMIGVFALDLMIYPADGDAIYYEGDAQHATFRWKTSLYGNQSANIDAAVTLYPDGRIAFFYGSNITNGLDWAAGISDGTGNYQILDLSGNDNPSNQKTALIPAKAYPYDMFVSTEGMFQGTTPANENNWSIDFKVTDNNNISSIKSVDFSTVTAGIDIDNKLQLNCYPNPATTYVHFTYSLQQPTPVQVSIYDLQGKAVAQLLNKPQTAGPKQLVWYPHLPKGQYIYQLKTNQGTQSGQLLLK